MSEFIIRAEETDLFFLFKDYKELIRCKDCKHYDIQVQQCTYEADWFGIEPNGFCNRAERKEE